MSATSKPLEFTCPACRRPFRISSETSVRTLVCPDCQAEVEVPQFEAIGGGPPPGSQPPPPQDDSSAPSPEPTAAEPQQQTAPAPAHGRTVSARSRNAPQAEPIYVAPTHKPSGRKRLAGWFFHTFLDSKTGLLILVVAIGGGGMAAWLTWQRNAFQQHEAAVLAAWDDADSLFRQGQFERAGKGYETVRERAIAWGRFGRKHADLADRMTELSRPARGLANLLEAGRGDLTRVFEKLRELGEPLAGGDFDKPAAVATADSDTDPPVGLDYSKPDRWRQVIDVWLVTRTARLVEELGSTTIPPAARVTQLEALAGFLGSLGRDATAVTTACREARTTLAVTSGQTRFEEAATTALADYSPASVRRAYSLWKDLQADHRQRVDEKAWTRFTDRLGTGLLKKARDAIVADGTPGVGQIDKSQPPFVPLPASATGVPPAAAVAADGEVVFALDEERVVALAAASGQPLWAIRQGFAGSQLPIRGRAADQELCVVHWITEEGCHLAVLRASDGQTIWSWHLPGRSVPRDPPLIIGDSLLVQWRKGPGGLGGQVWQFELATGTVRARVQFPEPLAAALRVNSADGTLFCLGRQLASYRVALTPVLTITAVQLRDEVVDAADLHSAWVHPFLLVFENRTDATCLLSVFHDDQGRLQRVQRLSLPGKLWQSPPVLGHAVFVATDSGHQALLQVRAGLQSDPVVTAWSNADASAPPALPGLRPFQASHADAPCVVAYRSTIEASFLVDNGSGDAAIRKTAWSWSFPKGDTVVHQPLQSTPAGLVAAGRRPGQPGVHIVCLDPATGRPRWTTSLSEGDSETLVPPSPAARPAASPATPLRIGHVVSIDALDPWNASRPLEREIVPLLFDRLMEPSHDGTRFVRSRLVDRLAIATGTRSAANGAACEAVRLTLAQGRKFSDGTPLAAGDVVASISRLAHSTLAWHHREQARLLHEPVAVTSRDLEVLIRPYPASGSLLGLYVVPGRHYRQVSPRGSALSRFPIGSGRFRVVEHPRGGGLRLERNPHHPRPRGSSGGFDEILFERFARDQVGLAMAKLRRGELDLLIGLGPEELSQIEPDQLAGRTVALPQDTVAVVAINGRRRPFRSADRRRAIVEAIDRRALLDRLGRPPGGLPGPRLTIGSLLPGRFDADVKVPPGPSRLVSEHRIAELNKTAKRRLQVKYCDEDPLMAAAAVGITAQLKALGLDIGTERLNWDRMEEELCRQHSFDLAVWFLVHQDPLLNPAGLFDPRTPAGVPSTNYFGFAPQPFLQYLVDLRQAATPTDLRQARTRIEQYLVDEAVFIPLWTQPQYAVVSGDLQIPDLPTAATGGGPWLFARIDEWTRRSGEQP